MHVLSKYNNLTRYNMIARVTYSVSRPYQLIIYVFHKYHLIDFESIDTIDQCLCSHKSQVST